MKPNRYMGYNVLPSGTYLGVIFVSSWGAVVSYRVEYDSKMD